MPIFSHRRSYAETVEGRRRFFSRLKVLLLVFLAFEAVVGLFVASYSVSSTAMAPTIRPGDRILGSPIVYGPVTALGKLPGIARPDHGDLVLVDPPYAERPSFWTSVADAFVRFVTFQRVSLTGRGSEASLNGPFVERVIAVPGDVVSMSDFVFNVKAGGHELSEFELSSHRYDITKPSLPQGWDPSFPLSGTMGSRTLGKDEYFLAGDNRGSSSDSRLWGPVKLDRIRAQIFLRYWPFRRAGAP